jgi:hypothetical protein
VHESGVRAVLIVVTNTFSLLCDEMPSECVNDFIRPHVTYLLTQWSRDLPEILTGLQLVKKFPSLYGTRKFITAFTSVRHLSLSWASSIQAIHPHPTSWRSILILSYLLRLGFPSGLFTSCFPIKTLYTPLPSTIRATCPAQLILLDFITRTIVGEEYRSLSFMCHIQSNLKLQTCS